VFSHAFITSLYSNAIFEQSSESGAKIAANVFRCETFCSVFKTFFSQKPSKLCKYIALINLKKQQRIKVPARQS